MTFLAYLVYGLILLPLSLIPLPILYLLSDGLRFIVFDLIGYRKEVVRRNLRNSFPEAAGSELRRIEKAFQRNFCDIFFAETIKSFSPFRGYLKKMITIKNIEVMEEQFNKGRGVILISGHFGNWELQAKLNRFPKFKHHLLGIYKVQSVIADKLMKMSRGSSGTELIPMEGVKKSFDENAGNPAAYIFIGDQSPGNPKSAYWMSFLNQETGVLFGTEKTAKIYNYSVVFLDMPRVKRGRYAVEFTLITEDPKSTKAGEITEAHTQLLEQAIIRQPESWLWSHRRWKHKNPAKT